MPQAPHAKLKSLSVSMKKLPAQGAISSILPFTAVRPVVAAGRKKAPIGRLSSFSAALVTTTTGVLLFQAGLVKKRSILPSGLVAIDANGTVRVFFGSR
ncbi:unnamed protein product [Prunus armeniaca]